MLLHVQQHLADAVARTAAVGRCYRSHCSKTPLALVLSGLLQLLSSAYPLCQVKAEYAQPTAVDIVIPNASSVQLRHTSPH